jgi:creatinine amidohydrolase
LLHVFTKEVKIFFSRGSAAALDVGSGGDYMVASDILDLDTRDKMADNGAKQICGMVERMDMPHVVDQLRKLEAYGLQNEEKYPWMPAAWNRNH